MKKILLMAMIWIAGMMLAGCKPTTDPKPDPDPEETFWDADGNGIPDWQEKEITLKYATWQYTQADMVTVDLLLIDAFMERYPNITVEMQIVSEWYDWDTSFLSLLEASNLPDVFLVQRLGSFLPYNILADISTYFDNDPDTEYIFPSVKDLGTYGGKRFAIPTFIYPNIWFVNLDLLNQAAIPAPSYNWTYAQMEAIAKSAVNPSQRILGVYGCNFYRNQYPKVLKMASDLEVGRGWYAFGYDGNRFNFDDSVMQTAVNAMDAAIEGGYCKAGISAAELEEWYNDPGFVPTYGGKVAMWSEPSWSAKDYFETFAFDWDAYPGPGGVTGGNTDIGGVSSLSQNKAAAYQLLKWMSFGEEGLLKRFEIFEAVGNELFKQGNNYPYPIVDYGIDGQGVNKVWESIPYGSVAPGMVSPEFIESIRNGAIWANKETIGWDAVDGAVGPYFTDIIYGVNDYASLKETIQAAADVALSDARRAMRDILGY